MGALDSNLKGLMVRQLFKVLWHAGAAIFWLGMALMAFTALMFTACENTVFEENYSPDGSLKAVVAAAECGNFSDPQTHIFVKEADGSRETDVVLRLDGHPKALDYQFSWSGDKDLLIHNFDFDKMLEIKRKSWRDNFVRVSFAVKQSKDPGN